jgi:hypothetical protein
MTEHDTDTDDAAAYTVGINVIPALDGRNRLTVFFRFFLALPHLILVGGPAAVGGWLSMNMGDGRGLSSSTGIIGFLAAVATVVAWLAILLTGRHPDALWGFSAWYLRWRVRAVAYMTLLRDEYPPFGEGGTGYPATLALSRPAGERNRLTAFFRFILAVPHLLVLVVLSAIWAFTTALAWIMILLTGRYPETLYGFALGVLAWGVRVEAYILLLRDEYPPFSLRA